MKASSYKNPFRTIWAVRKWFKLPKMKFWFYKLYKKDEDISPIYMKTRDVNWKPKFDTPRHEHNPYIKFIFFRKYVIDIQFTYGDILVDDTTYEQIIWTLYYCDNDIKKAYQTWPWYNPDTSMTSWDKSLMTRKGRKTIANVEWDTGLLSHP